MSLSPKQRVAALKKKSTLLTACPGSGKTTTIVAKLIGCLDDVRDSLRKVACITYTNAAVHEIEHRLHRQNASITSGSNIEISTIRTFCINNILGKFFWRLPRFREGFTVVSPDSEEFLAAIQEVTESHRLVLKSRDPFENLNRAPDGSPISRDLPPRVVLDFWDKLQRQKLIDFPNIVFESYRLIESYPSIARGLASKFEWILVDEFQDTSELQVEILQRISNYNLTKFFLVGDPHQSIFGFAGARPDLFDTFSAAINAERDIALEKNYRASSVLVKHAENFIPRVPPMVAAGPCKDISISPVHVRVDDFVEGIVDYFLPSLDEYGIPLSEAAVFAPWWLPLFNLAQKLRKYEIPIVGPGARPYGQRHTFGLLCEDVCAYVLDRKPNRLKYISRSLRTLLVDANVAQSESLDSFASKIVLMNLVSSAKKLSDRHPAAIDFMEAAAEDFTAILTDAELLSSRNQRYLKDSVEQMKSVMLKRGVDLENFSVEQLGVFANPDKNLKLLSLHSCKGREFDGVAIIDIHDNRVPHFGSRTPEGINESRRLFYVSVTRARKLLMFFTLTKSEPSRFLSEYF